MASMSPQHMWVDALEKPGMRCTFRSRRHDEVWDRHRLLQAASASRCSRSRRGRGCLAAPPAARLPAAAPASAGVLLLAASARSSLSSKVSGAAADASHFRLSRCCAGMLRPAASWLQRRLETMSGCICGVGPWKSLPSKLRWRAATSRIGGCHCLPTRCRSADCVALLRPAATCRGLRKMPGHCTELRCIALRLLLGRRSTGCNPA